MNRPAPSRTVTNLLPVLLLASASPLASAQSVAVGLKAGIRPSSDLAASSGLTSESKRYAVGPMVTVALPRGFAIEAGALYRRFAYSVRSFPILSSGIYSRWTADSWEFPIIVRRHILPGLYAGLGYAPRVMHGEVSDNGIYFADLSKLVPVYFASTNPERINTTHGLVIAAGIEKRLMRLRIAPEIRYTYWNRPAFDVARGDYGPWFQSSQNQVDFLLGITFH